jgi:hypothetical protein
VRGLRVGEYADLAEQGVLNLTDRLYVYAAHTGLLGWDNLYVKKGGKKVLVEWEGKSADWLDSKTLSEIGKFIYHDLTVLSEEGVEKFQGFVRFLYWQSDDDNRTKAETYDCRVCLEKGYAPSRPCGKFDLEYRENYGKGEDEEDKEKEEARKKLEEARKMAGRSRDKYSSKRRRPTQIQAIDMTEKRQVADSVVLDNFEYPECPVSWIDEWIQVIGSALYYAEKADQSFFGGGVADQLYRLNRAAKIITSESNKIEREQMDREKKK